MDNRAFSRFSTGPAGKMAATVECDGNVYQGWLEDVSLRGMFVDVSDRIPPGAEVDITLWLSGPDREPSLKCRGLVVRSKGGGIAVEIREMGKEAFAHFRTLVANMCPDPDTVEDELRDYVNPET